MKKHSKFLPVVLWLGLFVLCGSSAFFYSNNSKYVSSIPLRFESEPQSMAQTEKITLYRVSMNIIDTSVAFEMNISYFINGTKDSGYKRFVLPANSFAFFDLLSISIHDDLGRSIDHAYRSFTGYSGEKYHEISYFRMNFQGNRTLSIHFKIFGLISEYESGSVLDLKNIGMFSTPVEKAEYIIHFPSLYHANSYLIQSDQRTLANVSNNQEPFIQFSQYNSLSANLRFIFSPKLASYYNLFFILLSLGFVWAIYQWIQLVQNVRKAQADRIEESQGIHYSSEELFQAINVMDLYYLHHYNQSNKDLVLTLTKLAFVDLIFQKYITVVENRLYRVISHTSPKDPFYLGLIDHISNAGITFPDLIVRAKDFILKTLGDMKSRVILQQWMENPNNMRKKIISNIFYSLVIAIGATLLHHWAFFASNWTGIIVGLIWGCWIILCLVNLVNPFHIYSAYLTPKGLAITRQSQEMIARFRKSFEMLFSKSAKAENLMKEISQYYPYFAYLTLLPAFQVSFNSIRNWLDGLFSLEQQWKQDGEFNRLIETLLFPLNTADLSIQIDPLVLFPPATSSGSGGCSSCGGGGGCSSCGGGGGGCGGCGS